MKQIIILTLSVLILGLAACTTTAPPELYAPAGPNQPSYSIGGELDPFNRGSAVVTITINEEVVIQAKVPAFSKRTEATGTFEGKPVSVLLTKIRKFTSSYVRADVTIDGEGAASLIL